MRFDALGPDGDVGAWLAEFVALEAKGWKGREGTAFRERAHDARWLEEVVRAAFARGRLDALALRHDGRAIAMKLNFLAADGAFAFKIAFDEAWGKYSPGVLLELENVRRVHARPDVRWMDSCADPHHPMANRLWSGRRVYEDFFFALRGGFPALVLSTMPLGRWLRGAFRRRTTPSSGDNRVVTGERSSAGVSLPPPFLVLDAAAFRDGFDRHPFRIGHRLEHHPLFELERLVRLGASHPPELVEYNAGDVSIGLDPARTPRTGLSVEETIRRIEGCRSWMVIKHVERDPEYRALLDATLEEVGALSEGIDPGMCEREGHVFVSSPGSVTPFHMDHEHNFLLQIRGTKTIRQWDRDDRSILAEEDLERFYDGAHRNLPYRDDFEAKARVFELTPGDGLHFPINAPHWVKNGDAVSVSFSITFKTPRALRRGALLRVNAKLRARGWKPSPPGLHPVRDAAKWGLFRVARGAKRLLGRGEGATGGY